MERWSGKTAMVTGASSGIGACIAEELAKAGMKVFVLARRVERLEENARKISGAKGKLYPIKCDITKEQDVLAAFKYVKEKSGGVHVLVNNAGIARQGTLLDGKTADWKEVIDTNLLGLCVCSREAIASMREHGIDDGHIININSIGGHYMIRLGNYTEDIYTATKHGVTAITEALRHQLRDAKTRIKVTSVSPGFVKTEIADGLNDVDEIMAFLEKAPYLNPIDIANAVLYTLGTPPHVQVHELIIRPLGETM